MTELEQRLTNEFGKLAEQYEQAGKRYAKWVNQTEALAEDQQKMGAHITKIDRRLRKTDQHMQRIYERLQRARGGFKRTVSLIHAEAEQKRKAGDRGGPDR